jgi:cytochrome b
MSEAMRQDLVPVRVWDLPTRVFHWSLVLLVAFSAITGEFGEDLPLKFMDWHRLSGYAILALLLFRLVWGVIGSTHARFASFVRGPSAALRYVQEVLGRAPATPHLGHNPLGGWSVLALLASLAVQVGTGLFIEDEDLGVEGPFARLVSNRVSDALAEVHEANIGVLLALIGLHLGAIAFYRLAKGENLVRPMITGFKQLPPQGANGAARGGHALLGVLVLAMSGATVWLLVNKV